MSDPRHGRPWHTSEDRGANGTSAAPPKSDAESSGCTKMDLVRALLFLFNVVFVLIGITLVGIGIWTTVDKIYVSSIIGSDLFSASSYMIIVIGVITASICILGIYCVLKEKLKLTVLYCGLLIFAAVFLLIIGIIVVVFQSELEGAMVNEMRSTLINGYGSDKDVTDAWDQVQSDLECCAISQELIGSGYNAYSYDYVDGTKPTTDIERKAQDSWPVYKRTSFFKAQKDMSQTEKKFVPTSCCVYDKSTDDYLNKKYCQNFANGPPTNYDTDLKNNYIYYEGCYEKAKTLILDQSVILLVMGFVFALVMITGIFLTFLLMRRILNERGSESKRRREPDNL